MSQQGKNPPAVQETWVQSLSQEDPLEKEMAIHSSFLIWKITMDRGGWWATVHVVARVRYFLATKPPQTIKVPRGVQSHSPVDSSLGLLSLVFVRKTYH